MNKILVLGAGRSSTYLIHYLAKEAKKYQWKMTVADINLEAVQQKIKDFPHVKALVLEINNLNKTQKAIEEVDIVISLLPPKLHFQIAEICLESQVHLLTASYLTPEMKALHSKVQQRGLLFLNEMGLDPGIDHMSAMQALDKIRQQGGKIVSFRSYTGGLVAPESDDNPWHYKITWNPRNVILAGQGGTAKFIEDGQYKFIPYYQIFQRIKSLKIAGLGEYEGYANRDSLKYRELYNLQDVPTIFRGTIRHKGFCKAWNILVQLGLTDDSFKITNMKNFTYRDFTNSFLFYHPTTLLENKLEEFTGLSIESETLQKIKWLGLLEQIKIPFEEATPAQVLQTLMQEKCKLQSQDKDMIVMQHQIEYEQNKQTLSQTLNLITKGENLEKTAMAKTVGLPLGIYTKHLLLDNNFPKGVHIPVKEEIYNPVLKELTTFGISFH